MKTFGTGTLDTLTGFFGKLSTFMNALVGVFHALMPLLDALTKINVMPILLDKAGFKGDLAEWLKAPPTVTLADLADQQSREAANTRLQDWLTSVNRRAAAAGGLFGILGAGGLYFYIRSKLKPVRKVISIAFGKSEDVEESGALVGPLPEFPDISATFTAGLEPLRESLVGFIPVLKADTQAVIDKGVEALDAIGKHFDRAAASALRGPSAEKMLAISTAAETMAEKAMPSSDVEGGEPNAVLAAIARSWENWFVRDQQGSRAGFDILGTIIPEYIAAMRRYWAERQARGEEATVRLPEDLPADFPTSPHIMALHPVLSRTLVPRVTIDATGHALDEALADRVAGAFLDRVQEAHRNGLKKLAAIQAASGV
jgi:hypothetical protein